MTDNLALQVAEKLGWGFRADSRGYFLCQNDGTEILLGDHPFSASCWHCAGLVLKAMWQRGFEWYVTPGQAEFSIQLNVEWEGDEPYGVVWGYDPESPTAIFAAALEALGEGP